MNALLTDPREFTSVVQRFFTEKLTQQQNLSPRTVAACRDTFRLLLAYIKRQLNKAPTAVSINDFDAKLILGFLDYLEVERHNCIRSRNARLAAVRAFTQYMALQCPPALDQTQQVLAIPSKRFDKPLLGYLSRGKVQAVLDAPSNSTWFGARGRVLLAPLYNTGARVSELTGIRVADVIFEGTAYVRIQGKGRKQRTVPLWKATAALVRTWVQRQVLLPNQPVVPNRYGRPMERSNVAERLKLAVVLAAARCPQLKGRNVTPHTMRHSTAMHLLQAGVDITVIALWLGHESPVTTHGYVAADLAMKERALATVCPPGMRKTRYSAPDKLLEFLEKL